MGETAKLMPRNRDAEKDKNTALRVSADRSGDRQKVNLQPRSVEPLNRRSRTFSRRRQNAHSAVLACLFRLAETAVGQSEDFFVADLPWLVEKQWERSKY